MGLRRRRDVRLVRHPGRRRAPRRTRPGDAGTAERARSSPSRRDRGRRRHCACGRARRATCARLIERTAPSRQPFDGVDGRADSPRSPAPLRRRRSCSSPTTACSRWTPPRRGVAVIGWRADQPEVQGGGSAQVTPPYVITPLQGITDRAGADAVEFQAGRVTTRAVALGGRLLAPTDGAACRSTSTTSPPAISRARRSTASAARDHRVWLGEPAPGVAPGDSPRDEREVHARRVRPLDALGVGCRHRGSVPRRRARGRHRRRPDRCRSARPVHTPAEHAVELTAGVAYEVVAEFDAAAADGPVALAGLTVEARPPAQPDAVERGVSAAAEAGVAVVVVGRDDRESEGVDTPVDGPAGRTSRARPTGRGRERVDRCRREHRVADHDGLGRRGRRHRAAVVPRSRDRRRARRGVVRRCRRLGPPHDHPPAPARGQPAYANFPGRDGTVEYAEGLFVGYRHYDANDVAPRCFGHGLSYTTFVYSSLLVAVGERDRDAPGPWCRST